MLCWRCVSAARYVLRNAAVRRVSGGEWCVRRYIGVGGIDLPVFRTDGTGLADGARLMRLTVIVPPGEGQSLDS